MRYKPINFAAVVVLLYAAFAAFVIFTVPMSSGYECDRETIVAVNEIEKLYQSGKPEEAHNAAEKLYSSLESSTRHGDSRVKLILLGGGGLFLIICMTAYIYVTVIRPFDKLSFFAQEVARGNLDFPLQYERKNYFGSFTWAFDSMRHEINRSRMREKKAAEHNKTVIAALSHDIRTPIASIRACAEALSAVKDLRPERRERYISVILRKSDEVVKLTDDLIIHSVTDMDKLEFVNKKNELCSFIKDEVSGLDAEKDDIDFTPADFAAEVTVDKRRISQLLENLVVNSRKYACTRIRIFFTRSSEAVQLHVADSGSGVPDEDMPFIFGKFYRGRNCGNEKGSGLGLYIVKYIAEKSGGSVGLYNHKDGFEAVVELPVNEFSDKASDKEKTEEKK